MHALLKIKPKSVNLSLTVTAKSDSRFLAWIVRRSTYTHTSRWGWYPSHRPLCFQSGSYLFCLSLSRPTRVKEWMMRRPRRAGSLWLQLTVYTKTNDRSRVATYHSVCFKINCSTWDQSALAFAHDCVDKNECSLLEGFFTTSWSSYLHNNEGGFFWLQKWHKKNGNDYVTL